MQLTTYVLRILFSIIEHLYFLAWMNSTVCIVLMMGAYFNTHRNLNTTMKRKRFAPWKLLLLPGKSGRRDKDKVCILIISLVNFLVVSELTESLEQKRDREYKLILESELYDLPQSNLHVAADTAKVWTQLTHLFLSASFSVLPLVYITSTLLCPLNHPWSQVNIPLYPLPYSSGIMINMWIECVHVCIWYWHPCMGYYSAFHTNNADDF